MNKFSMDKDLLVRMLIEVSSDNRDNVMKHSHINRISENMSSVEDFDERFLYELSHPNLGVIRSFKGNSYYMDEYNINTKNAVNQLNKSYSFSNKLIGKLLNDYKINSK